MNALLKIPWLYLSSHKGFYVSNLGFIIFDRPVLKRLACTLFKDFSVLNVLKYAVLNKADPSGRAV